MSNEKYGVASLEDALDPNAMQRAVSNQTAFEPNATQNAY